MTQSSTAVAREVIEALGKTEPAISQALGEVQNWRRDYQKVFAAITRAEASSDASAVKIARTGIETLAGVFGFREVAAQGWKQKSRVETQTIGTPSGEVIVALGGNGELSTVRNALSDGKTVAVISRPNDKKWSATIDFARQTKGCLIIPMRDGVAGLDLVADLADVAGWVKTLAGNIVVSNFLYAPGFEHLKAEVAAEALIHVIRQNKKLAALTWLGTPTDSILLTLKQLTSNLEAFQRRSIATRLRDWLLQRFGMLQRPANDLIWDASVNMQGPNYLLAKRLQRWQALLELQGATRFSYLVVPPADTDSVLRHGTLQIAYRGTESIGIYPAKSEELRDHAWKLSQQDLRDGHRRTGLLAIDIHANADAGGLWQLAYQPNSAWQAAFVIGFLKAPLRALRIFASRSK